MAAATHTEEKLVPSRASVKDARVLSMDLGGGDIGLSERMQIIMKKARGEWMRMTHPEDRGGGATCLAVGCMVA